MRWNLGLMAGAIKEAKPESIVFMVGAGISTEAGIPDFRSPGTGLYYNLAKLNLPYAEAVFDINYYKKSPKAFNTLALELYPGNFNPTKFHCFMKIIQDKGLLKRIYTQNIDTLERIVGIESDKIIEAHGSFASNHCIDCNTEMSVSEFKKQLINKETNYTPTCPKCKGFVKPDIVFFGEGLPSKFFRQWEKDKNDNIDVAFIVGTSLTVHPFAELPYELPSTTTRAFINKVEAGGFSMRSMGRDLVMIAECDSCIQRIAELCGWDKELNDIYNSFKNKSENTKKDDINEPKSTKEEPKNSKLSTTKLKPREETININDKDKNNANIKEVSTDVIVDNLTKEVEDLKLTKETKIKDENKKENEPKLTVSHGNDSPTSKASEAETEKKK